MSKLKKVICFCLFLLVTGGSAVWADDEASNVVYVKSSRYGRSYAKCIPAEYYGSKGETGIYIVGEGDDHLEFTYPWYSQEVYLGEMAFGISVVRMKSSPRGREANKDDLAIGFYFSGKTLKEYSTLDIAGSPRNVGLSASHYSWYRSVSGYREIGNNDYVFEIIGRDGKTIAFDARTGEILK
jgi:hypothetical protein